MNRNEDFMVAEWRVQPQLNRLLVEDQTTSVEPKVMEVLLCLGAQAPRVITKQALLEGVWKGAFVTDEVLTNAIWELRRALGDSAKTPRFIETIRGRGYRLLIPPEPVIPARPGASSARPMAHQRQARRGRSVGICLTIIATLALPLWLVSRPEPVSTRNSPRTHSTTGHPSSSRELGATSPASSLVSRGRFLLAQGSRQSREQALHSFAAAVAKDPDYAPAYAGLADSYALHRESSRSPILPMIQTAAKAAASRAVELDDNLAEAHLARARVAGPVEGDWSLAEASLHRALELDPKNERAHQLYATFLSATGRPEEALEHLYDARQWRPESLRLHHHLARLLYVANRPEEAIAALRELLESDPQSPRLRVLLALSYLETGEHGNAARALQGLGSDSQHRGEIGYTLAQIGQRDRASRLLQQELASPEPSAYDAALILTGLGQRLAALDWLEYLVDQRQSNAWRIASDPILRSLQREPRFQRLLHRLGLATTTH